jgi:hypothetical protein
MYEYSTTSTLIGILFRLLSIFLSHFTPSLLILPQLLNFTQAHLKSVPLKSPFPPISQEIDTFRWFPYNFFFLLSFVYPLRYPPSARQVYINHRGMATHKRVAPSLAPHTLHETGGQEKVRHHVRVKAIQIPYGVWKTRLSYYAYMWLH